MRTTIDIDYQLFFYEAKKLAVVSNVK